MNRSLGLQDYKYFNLTKIALTGIEPTRTSYRKHPCERHPKRYPPNRSATAPTIYICISYLLSKEKAVKK